MDNWTEIKTAYLLGQLGTVSATAESIGVHRATVIRRVESLERQLGGKLFQRHKRGYHPTELGIELTKVAEHSDQNFRQLFLKARTQEQEIAGQFVISCPELVDHIAFTAVKNFKDQHSKVNVRFISSNIIVKLEHGEADVAITLGDPPDHPDYVVRRLTTMPVGLYASKTNTRCFTTVEGTNQIIRKVPFIVCEQSIYGKAIEQWTKNNIDADQIVLTSSTIRGANDAILSGLGAGFLPRDFGEDIDQLKEILQPGQDWSVPLWVVTHVDLHRSRKVQSFLSHIDGSTH